MAAYLFPGQGSQYVGMAREYYENFPEAKEAIQEADDTLGYSLSAVMFSGPEDILRQTERTQPAIFLHSVVALKCGDDLPEADAFAGHSLGEYSALYAAGVFDFPTALRLVQLRGSLMAEAGRRSEGTMAAIVGLNEVALRALLERVERETEAIVRPANFNSPGQIVISGSVLGVREAMRRSKEAGAKLTKELAVSGAFHSPLMQYAADGLQEALQDAQMSDPSAPVFMNVTAEAESTTTNIRKLLVDQLTCPVLWEQSIRKMYDTGHRDFVEIGPGKVLQGLVTRTVTGVSVRNIDKPITAKAD